MKVSCVKIENYKGIHRAKCELSDFVCVVGENNAGKSTLLQAIILFINGSKLTPDAYHNPGEDILITVTLAGITSDVLAALPEEHRVKLISFVKDETLTLARRYASDGSSKLRHVTLVPRELKYRPEHTESIFKGKKGREIQDILKREYPEVGDADSVEQVSTQKGAKDIIQAHVEQLNFECFEESDIPLATGIDNSLKAILPDPIYIPAVKDLADDLKTKEGASFGKLLNVLLDVIESELRDAVDTFENLRKKLNRIKLDDGTVVDDRMERVQAIEAAIQNNLKDTFRDVRIELEIPPPEVKAILSNATVLADDGIRGPVSHKGDGFRRAIAFSILRSYVELSNDAKWSRDFNGARTSRDKFLFLFEEPELYLHPTAQNILFEALSLISRRHQTIVTSHSPLFFSADRTTSFVKMYKQRDSVSRKPRSICKSVDISGVSERDIFQLISFESSNLAFFSRKILLVEGDSELIVLPHVARLLNPQWDFKSTSTSIIKISGKGSFQRYKNFFKRFDVEVAMLADLDVLVEGFEKLDASDKAKTIRSELIDAVDAVLKEANHSPSSNPKFLKEELQRERFARKFEELKAARDKNDTAATVMVLEELFAFEYNKPRLEVLMDVGRKTIIDKKRKLLSELRGCNVYVLEKGTIEKYYPSAVTGSGKLERAQSFCSIVKHHTELIPLSDMISHGDSEVPELQLILEGVFSVAR